METSSATATAVQPPCKSVDGEGDSKPGSVNPILYGLRKSCDRCRRQKKKCDGGRPCGRCLGAQDRCTYSMRRWHQPNHHHHHHHHQPRDPGPVQLSQVAQHSTSGAVLGHKDMLQFKRCRLSASPATGLVGMQENAFLRDFFGCVGFLPLTTQSHIRETMVKIMLNPASTRHSVFGGGCGEARPADAAAMRRSLGNAFGGKELPMGPSTCTFWCAVALGALVQGSPIESVTRYLQLATEALAHSDQYSGLADSDIATAWAMLGYLYGFMGDEAKYREYLALSDTFLTTSVEQGSTDALPVGFAEVIQHREVDGTFHRKIESVCPGQQTLPKLSGGASEHELCLYVLQSFHVFEQAVYARMVNDSAAGTDSLGSAKPTGEGTRGQPHRKGVLGPEEMSEAMASVWSPDDNIVQFGPLEEAVERPSIRAGMGGLLINATLVFDAACKGDVCGTLKRLDRCVDVFVRYPGLSRSIMGAHWVHILSAALAALDVSGARGMYKVLRSVYNPCRSRGSSPLPPLEEWQGLSAMCEDTYCRAIEGVIAADKMKAFSNPAGRSVSCEITGDGGGKPLGLAGQAQSRWSAASSTLCKEPVTPGSYCPGSSSGRSDLWSACLESTKSPKTPTAPASRAPTPNGSNSEAEFDEEAGASSDTNDVHSRNEGLVGGLVAPHATMLVMPQALSEGLVEDTEGDDLAAADWLEAIHALS